MSDPRFARLRTDPRFRKPKKGHTKVTVDERFKSVFEVDTSRNKRDARRVDKYGRKFSTTDDTDNPRRYYRLEEKGEALDGPQRPDFARGDVLLESSDEEHSAVSESDEQDSQEVVLGYRSSKPIPVSANLDQLEVDLNEDDVAYADLDEQAAEYKQDDEDNVKGIDEVKSKRLAVVNLDWDHVRAMHLYRIFSSIVSPAPHTGRDAPRSSTAHHGKVLSVRVYPSNFGRERMKREEVEGPPKDIFKRSRRSDGDGIGALFEEDEGDEYDEDALRKYQLERLRYYYAIVTCDSADTATYIYTELNGTELERSANVFEISFVPGDMSFDEESRDEVTPETDLEGVSYKGLDFSTDALRHSKVKLHWDEDDPERNKVTRRTLSRKEIEEENFRAFIASSESEASDTETNTQARKDRDRLRSLLLSGENEELPEGWGENAFISDRGNNGEVEITFMPGLSEAKDGAEEETTLDRYKRKQKERRKQRKEELIAKPDKSSGKTARQAAPEAPKDDFFVAGNDDENTASAEEGERRNETTEAEMALLVAPDDPSKVLKHFDMKAVLKAEKGKKKKNPTHINDDELQEDFQVDVKDDRFKSLHEDHTFAIDPSNPHFKKTKGMAALLEERSKRWRVDNPEAQRVQVVKDVKSASVQSLVESVKRKSSGVHGQGLGKRQRH